MREEYKRLKDLGFDSIETKRIEMGDGPLVAVSTIISAYGTTEEDAMGLLADMLQAAAGASSKLSTRKGLCSGKGGINNMKEYSAGDVEKITKAKQSANLAVQDLREIVKADDPLLAEMSLDMLEQMTQFEARLGRILSLVAPGEK